MTLPGNTTIYPPNSTSTSEIRRVETLLSVDDLKKRFLHGINLKNKDGVELSDFVLQFYIDAAVTMLEDDLEIYITPLNITENRDYVVNDYLSWAIIELDNNPVISLDKFQIRFLKDTAYVDFPEEWIRLDQTTGVVRVAATIGTIQNWIMTSFSFLPRLVTRLYDFPHFFYFEYKAGFEQDKVPKSINMAVGLLASIYALAVLSNLVLTPGIANESLSIDGLSQSVSTTGGGGKLTFGATIDQYMKMLWGDKQLGMGGIIPNLRKQWSRELTVDVI